MTDSDTLSKTLSDCQVNDDYTEAVLTLADGSRLCFCHRVGERWAKAVGPDANPDDGGQANALLQRVKMFRLNAKHLDIAWADGSRWEHRIRATG